MAIQSGPSGHDHGYKRLFSQPTAVEELLRGFLREDWTEALDFATLERVGSSFVSDDLHERHSDVVWRLRFRGETGDWFYLYLLLELQSTSDPFMAVRLLTYVGLLLEAIIRSENLTTGDRLPAVLPLVIHSGKRPWRAPRDLAHLFVPVPRALRRRLPRLAYHVLDVGRMDLDGRHLARNRVAAAFRIEAGGDLEHVVPLVKRLARLRPHGKEPELRRSFTVWLKSLLRRTFPGVRIPEAIDWKGVSMLEESAREWAMQYRREGRKEGRQEGLVEGMRKVLLRQMAVRFGRIPRGVRRQVEQVTSVQELDKLTRKVLAAESLEEMGLG
jgi:predicted transposase YdaD